MQFYNVNICQVMIFKFYAAYNKHDMVKIGNKTREKHKYYRKCLNNFAVGFNSLSLMPSLFFFFLSKQLYSPEGRKQSNQY